MSDFKGAALVFDAIPDAKNLLGDKGYDADWFRPALQSRGIEPCIPPPAMITLISLMSKGSVRSIPPRPLPVP